MQILYAYFLTGGGNLEKVEKELNFSIQKTFDLYNFLLLFLTNLQQYANQRITLAKQKLAPTVEDLNPNLRFVNNQVIKMIEHSSTFQQNINTSRITWEKYPEFIKKIYLQLIETDFYKDYMSAEVSNFDADKDFVLTLLENLITENEELRQILEEQSIYWNDDFEFVLSILFKCIQLLKHDKYNGAIYSVVYKDNEDREYTRILFRKTVLNYDKLRGYIDTHTKNWDTERIAYTDRVIMMLAIVELTEFPAIPVKVTLNEYIEISKFYSTPNSCVFVNGVLDKITETLRKENKINKSGRGLIGEVEYLAQEENINN